MMYVIWFLIIVVDVAYNYWLIEVKKQRPNYRNHNIIRLAVGMVYYITIPLYEPIRFDQHVMVPLMMFTTFWFCFDLLLNVSRGKYFYYVNPEGSILDQFQDKTLGGLPWMWFKLILATAGLALSVKGYESLLTN
jgi:hypothetical protein